MSETLVSLPLPTNATEEGPRFRADDKQIVVEYDFHSDEGRTEWIAVAFEDVLQFEFRGEPCGTADDILTATQMRVRDESPRLTTMLERWQVDVGWHEWQQKHGGAARYKHFTLYFDDAGCIDVVAANYRLDRPGNRQPRSRSTDSMLHDVVEVIHLGAHRLRLRFDNGVEGEIDLAPKLEFHGVFAPLRDPSYFARVRIESGGGTICWPNDADIDPVVLYSWVTGLPISEFGGEDSGD